MTLFRNRVFSGIINQGSLDKTLLYLVWTSPQWLVSLEDEERTQRHKRGETMWLEVEIEVKHLTSKDCWQPQKTREALEFPPSDCRETNATNALTLDLCPSALMFQAAQFVLICYCIPMKQRQPVVSLLGREAKISELYSESPRMLSTQLTINKCILMNSTTSWVYGYISQTFKLSK